MKSRFGKVRVIAALLVALVAVAVTATVVSASTVHSARHHHKRHHHHACHIPQHGGGDGDSDNHGGPSDGDGCM